MSETGIARKALTSWAVAMSQGRFGAAGPVPKMANIDRYRRPRLAG